MRACNGGRATLSSISCTAFSAADLTLPPPRIDPLSGGVRLDYQNGGAQHCTTGGTEPLKYLSLLYIACALPRSLLSNLLGASTPMYCLYRHSLIRTEPYDYRQIDSIMIRTEGYMP